MATYLGAPHVLPGLHLPLEPLGQLLHVHPLQQGEQGVRLRWKINGSDCDGRSVGHTVMEDQWVRRGWKITGSHFDGRSVGHTAMKDQ